MIHVRPIHFIFFTIIGVLFIVFGFTGDGYLHKASILFGGLYIGNVMTEALNYDETTKEGA
jgi:hypothetical protein